MTFGVETVFFRASVGPSVSVSSTAADTWTGNTVVLFLRARPEGEGGPPVLGRVGEALDKSLSGVLSTFVKEEDFSAKEGTAKTLQVYGKNVKRVTMVGLGSGSKEETDWRTAGAAAAQELKNLKEGSAGLACLEGVQVQALVEGALLALHADKRFQGSKTPEKEKLSKGPTSIELLDASSPESKAAAERACMIVSGVVFARELVNAPANIVDPPGLAAAAEDMAKKLGLSAKVLDEKECEKMGMGSFLAVSKASNLGARLIHLTYKPAGGEAKRKIGICGKGVTFDSGGYNIKAGPGSLIELMKFDMGGSASTLGTAAVVAQLKPKDVEVHFIVAACENMISGNPGALRPGDIITAMDGTTIEVNNTDAEGRLTLADAMTYCQNQGTTEVIDIATLTGACMVALGTNIAGMWSNSDDLAHRLQTASQSTKEKMWRMPLEESYFEGMKSDFADMKNAGPRFGGAITAALFLQKFVRKDVAWAHVDIAGTAWAEKPKGINGTGGTGSMVRTLFEYIEQK
eukprot:TRINITY_DN7666_c0_g1_i2.p1 TRINITY_DN7666_c0_g1~~TRINITY_DN7666_c0_g1_i2.p1  ORF type:complete len:518 (+),score=138.04 TRINITY_DN7666_c0_g1_i2:56-1609(+)